jgi:uncharacterized protein YerC
MAAIQSIISDVDVVAPRFLNRGYHNQHMLQEGQTTYTVLSNVSQVSHATMSKVKNGMKQTAAKDSMRERLARKLFEKAQKKLTGPAADV